MSKIVRGNSFAKLEGDLSMKKVYLGLLALLVVAIAVPLAVQAQEPPAPGTGGAMIEGSTRSSANLGPLIPIRCSGVDCANPISLMYPGLIGIDPDTQSFAANQEGDLATGWEISEDGLEYTVTLRNDMTWNDGTPITATDVYFSWLAIQQGETVGLSGSYVQVRDEIPVAEVVDDFTIKLTLASPSCEGLRYVALIPPMPAHAFGYALGQEDFDWSSFIDHPFDDAPAVTAGAFQFNRIEPGTAIYLEPNPTYPDALFGGTLAEGWVILDTPDENVLVERFLSFRENEPNFIREPGAAVQGTLRNSDAQVFSGPGRIWHYMALNTADPSNPQNGLDADGNPIDQGFHPLFGDVRVRQALQHGINIDEIIAGPLNNNGTAMTGSTIPTAFTFNPDKPRRPFDLDAARALLDEAGWLATGEPLVEGGDGLRIASKDALYAEPGTPFYFELMNPGDFRNEVAVVIQDQLAVLGIEVDVLPLDFNTMYDTNMGAQIFDAAVAGWRGDLPFNPDQRNIFGASADVFGEGYQFNFGSYYNAEFEEISEKISTLPGCDEAERIALARQAQDILYEEQPYVWLYALNTVYAAAPGVQNFDPKPNFGDWNASELYFLAQ
jgi:peptide/nickel transport system substrate-binding protein